MATQGFTLLGNDLTIDKDNLAELSYAFDWVDWLIEGDAISTAEYTVQARLNDPSPVIAESSGVSGTKTYVVLSGGQLNKRYKVNCKITTSNGLVDRRYFIVNIIERSA